MRFLYIVTKMNNGEVLGIFPTQRKADKFVFSDKCNGISTRTTRIKKNDYR